jgi:beta-mannosidase
MKSRLAIWAGNNEDYMLAERYNWDYDRSDQTGPWDHTGFPARQIYERVLPDVCERLAGDVPYWRSSPYGGPEKESNDTTVGDVHIWDGESPFRVSIVQKRGGRERNGEG